MQLRPRIKNIRQAKDHEFLNLYHLGMIAGGKRSKRWFVATASASHPGLPQPQPQILPRAQIRT